MKQAVRIIIITAVILNLSVSIVSAQTIESNPKKQFVTFYFEWMKNSPMNFRETTLSKITGTPLDIFFDGNKLVYSSPDRTITVTNKKFDENIKGAGLMIYPFGAGNGTSLAVKIGYETMSQLRFMVNTPNSHRVYDFRGGRTYDFGIGVISGYQSPGWGLGANSFILIGIGQIHDRSDHGQRYFAEGGSSISFGMIGAGFVLKINRDKIPSLDYQKVNNFSIGLRTTLSF